MALLTGIDEVTEDAAALVAVFRSTMIRVATDSVGFA